jgi:hypothetical protein
MACSVTERNTLCTDLLSSDEKFQHPFEAVQVRMKREPIPYPINLKVSLYFYTGEQILDFESTECAE